MMLSKSALDSIKIASPCRSNWDDMTGDDRKRFCDLCQLNVYNVSSMTRAETEALLTNSDSDSVCLRLFRRTDGTIITKDCPVGVELLAKTKRRFKAWVAIAANIFNFTTPAFADELKTCNPEKQTTEAPTGQLSQLGSYDKYSFRPNTSKAFDPADKGAKNLSTFINEQSGQADTSAQTNYKRALMCEKMNRLAEALNYAKKAKALIEQNPEVYDAKFTSEVSDKCLKLVERVGKPSKDSATNNGK